MSRPHRHSRVLVGLLSLTLACIAPKRLAPPEVAVEETNELSDDLAGEGLDAMREDVARLRKLTDPLRLLAADRCPDAIVPYVGVMLETVTQAEPTPLDRARSLRGVAVNPTVVEVMPDSPAARAGLQRGDIIRSFNGHRTIFYGNFMDRLWLDSDEAPLLEIERSGDRLDVQLAYQAACTGPPVLYLSGALGTWHRSWGTERLYVPRGLMDFVDSDDELVIVIAHELAHMALDSTRESRRMTRELEVRADRMGLELALRAGYDIHAAVGIWERLAIQRPWMITRDRKLESRGSRVNHSHVAARALLMPSLITELESK